MEKVFLHRQLTSGKNAKDSCVTDKQFTEIWFKGHDRKSVILVGASFKYINVLFTILYKLFRLI